MRPAEDPIDHGVAGASARREHERRRANREQRVRAKHRRVGGVLLALTEAPQHESSWAQGAAGEERLAAALARRCRSDVAVLHDRAIPGSRANIDHLAICRSGVWVIDAKDYAGKVEICNPVFGKASLRIGGRDKTKLVDGVLGQVAVVRDALGPDPSLPVNGVIGFLGDGLPLWPKLTFRGVAVLSPRALAKRLNADGPLGEESIRRCVALLAERFPRA